MSTQQQLIHGAIIVVLIAAYTALTISNHDGTALLGALGGYLGGAAVTNAAVTGKV